MSARVIFIEKNRYYVQKNVPPTFKGGYKLEVNFGEKCQKEVVARSSAGHREHYVCCIFVFIRTFLSSHSLQAVKKHLFQCEFLNPDTKIGWFNLTP